MGINFENGISFDSAYTRGDMPVENLALKEQQKDRVGSAAFNLEYEQSYTDAELRDDVISYLGEYRFRVPKYEYDLVYGVDLNNVEEGSKVRDPHRRESMWEKSERKVIENRLAGKPIHREVAESSALDFLDRQLSRAKIGDTILWGSPPGPKNEGYDDYGFIFYGRVTDGRYELGIDEKHLKMMAINVTKPTLIQYNAFFNEFVENPVDFSHADQFLASPFALSSAVHEKLIDAALTKHFNFEIESQEQEIFEKVISEMDPMVDEFVALCKIGTNDQKLHAFNALENYALMLRDKYKTNFDESGGIAFSDSYTKDGKRLEDIVGDFGFKPPTVSGSCGSTETESSSASLTSSIFSREYKALMKKMGIEVDDEGFTCPKCGFEAIGPIGNTCPGCKITKEEYAKELGSVTCD